MDWFLSKGGYENVTVIISPISGICTLVSLTWTFVQFCCAGRNNSRIKSFSLNHIHSWIITILAPTNAKKMQVMRHLEWTDYDSLFFNQLKYICSPLYNIHIIGYWIKKNHFTRLQIKEMPISYTAVFTFTLYCCAILFIFHLKCSYFPPKWFVLSRQY